MALYCAPADVREILAPDGSPTGGTGASLSDTELTEAISEASDEIDATLSGHYPVPFDPNNLPAMVARIARDIAGYLATLVYRGSAPVPDGDPVALRYDRAQRFLAAVAAGSVELALPAGTTAAPEADAIQIAGDVENAYDGELFPMDEFALGFGDESPDWMAGEMGWGL